MQDSGSVNEPTPIPTSTYVNPDVNPAMASTRFSGFFQKKFLKIIPLILLLIGLGAGVFLSQQQQETRSRASLPPVVFKDASGMDLPLGQTGNPQTTSPTIKIQLNSPLGPASGGGVLAASTGPFSVSVSGPLNGTLGKPLTYKASADSAKTVTLFWMKSTDDPAKGSSWRKLGEANANVCSAAYAVGKTSCEVSGTFTPAAAGSYYIVVNVTNDQLGPCSGSPLLDGKTNKSAQPLPGWSDCGKNDRLTVDVKSGSSQQLTASLSGPATATINQTVSYSVRGDGIATKSMDVFVAKDGSDLTKSGAWTKIGGAPGSLCWPSYAVGLAYCTGDAKFTPKEAGKYYIVVNLVDDKLGSCSGNPSLPSGWKDCGANDLITLTVTASGPTPTPSSQAPIRVTLTGPDRATTGATIKYIANAVIAATNGSFGLGSGANIYVMKTDADLSNVQSVISGRSNESCGNEKQCVVSGEFPLTKPNPRGDAFVGEPGTYYVFASANGSLGSKSLHCSGNPLADGKTDYTSGKLFPGTADCGPSDRITLTVDPIGGSTPTPTPSPVGGSPTPTGAAAITTTHFRIAESSVDLDSAAWQAYTAHPMVIDYTFKDQSPGAKQIWIEFKNSNGIISPKQAAVVELVAPATPTGAVSPTGAQSGITASPNPCNISSGSTTCVTGVTYTFSSVESAKGVALCREEDNVSVSQMNSGTGATYNARLSAGSYSFKLVTPKWDCQYGTILDSETVVVNPSASGGTPTPTPSQSAPTPTPCPGGAKPVPSEPGGPPECPPL